MGSSLMIVNTGGCLHEDQRSDGLITHAEKTGALPTSEIKDYPALLEIRPPDLKFADRVDDRN